MNEKCNDFTSIITAQNTSQQLKKNFYGASDLTEDLPEGKKKMYNSILEDFDKQGKIKI